MNKWKPVSDYVLFSTKGITPAYVKDSSIIVLNQKCIRNGCIDYSLSQFTDDSKQISETKFVQKGDILINSTGIGTAGRVAFVDKLPDNKRLITDSHILLLRCHSYFEAQCLSYLLYSFENKLMSFMTGSSGQSELDKVVLMNLLLKLIENPSHQQKIAKALSDLDAKIELNNKINAELEAMAKTIYDYWFVQFDFPYVHGKPYKSSGGKMVWNEELKREIPEGWGVETVDAYAEVKKGDLITAKDSEDGNVKVVAAGVSYSYLHSTANRDKNTITISGSGANAGYINFWREPIFASDCITVRGKNDTITLMILHHLRLIQNYILSQATGSAQPHVYPTDIKILKYAVPPNHLIEQFGNIVLPMNDKIANNLKENQHLTSLRDWLLPMLMNGQVTVGHALREAQGDELGMVAEPKSDYKSSNDTFNEIFNQLNYDYEIAAVVSLTFQRFKCYYGKKYIHKMFSNIQMLNTLPVFKELTFQENGWGMFSPQIKKAIEDQKFVKFGEIKDNQKVLEVNIKYLKEIGNWIKDEENKAFVSQVNDMLTIYESPTINKKMDNIELFNTILECMKVLKTDNFEAIYHKMKAWPMKEEGYETKADKFTKMQTKGMILFIKEIKK